MANFRMSAVLIDVLLVAVTVANPALGNSACQNANCAIICNRSNRTTYKPQLCETCKCSGEGASSSDLSDPDSLEKRLDAVETSLFQLKVMTGVLLAVVLILLLAFVLLFIQRLNTPLLKLKTVLFCKKKAPRTNSTIGNPPPTVGRLANHQSDCSPHLRRATESKPSTLGDTSLEPLPRPYRVRQPSESTCPEEGNDIPQQGYDNFGLSTSTIDANALHNTSNSSMDTLGPAISTNTLHTTLPSLNHSPLNGHVNARI
ncbi:uncharacterized protein LOC135219679 [Macrobrachium nipponense]|uniref:uncharacterized protein LOC135219679 n=1 Tax=Macrobrachium nipponense TaxID=159736 RepID=UPI0030C7B8F7